MGQSKALLRTCWEHIGNNQNPKKSISLLLPPPPPHTTPAGLGQGIENWPV